MTRAVFRFVFVYFALYAVATPLAGSLVPAAGFAGLGVHWPLRAITSALATNGFHVPPPLVYTGNSGDTAFFWVQTFWLLIAALAAALVWTAVDHRREYSALNAWFRLALRFILAAQMFEYGMAKVIPTQFPPPSLVTLIEPVGNLSLSGLLWTTIGASSGYQMFTGCAEVIAGVLLVIPQTAALGALISLVDMVQVFVLNMAYDIGLKQISFHLVLMSIALLAPYLRTLANTLLDRTPGERIAAASPWPAAANRLALVVQIAVGVYLLTAYTYASRTMWFADGAGAPKSPLYGIWDVREMTVDGVAQPPEANDYDRRWHRIVFDAPTMAIIQRTDDSLAHYGATFKPDGKSLVLTMGGSRTWSSTFGVTQTSKDHLTLDGSMDGHTVHAEFQRVELDTFRVMNSGFRWVRPPDVSFP